MWYEFDLYEMNGEEKVATDYMLISAESEEQAWIEADERAYKNGYVDFGLATYTGAHFLGEVVDHNGHKCQVTNTWRSEGRNGISIMPTGGYGFEIDIYDEQL